MILSIITPLKLGNKTLLETSQPVTDFTDQSLQDLIKDMKDTMESYAGVGIAAPQIGVKKRVI